MPYYIYKKIQNLSPAPNSLQKMSKYDKFIDAKKDVRSMRAKNNEGNEVSYNIVFAENPLQAEEILNQKREKPILMEWEK
jgi:hypothetical protein